jgi:hypothetical protein
LQIEKLLWQQSVKKTHPLSEVCDVPYQMRESLDSEDFQEEAPIILRYDAIQILIDTNLTIRYNFETNRYESTLFVYGKGI